MNLHAHIDTRARDCDGVVDHSHVMTMNERELAGQDERNWFGDIDFHKRVVGAVVNTYSLDSTGMLTVTKREDGEVHLSWHEHTEEGFRAVEATICQDEGCDTGEEHHRDHAAEAAGY